MILLQEFVVLVQKERIVMLILIPMQPAYNAIMRFLLVLEVLRLLLSQVIGDMISFQKISWNVNKNMHAREV